MSRKLMMVLAVVVGALVGTSAWAQSSKNSMQVGNVALLKGVAPASGGGWSPIFKTSLHTSQQGDLQIAVSLEAGLFTDTKVSSKLGTSDTSVAEAMIEVQVLVDGKVADPGNVIFARRAQTLMAKFGGIMNYCRDSNLDGIITAAECDWTDEELQLVLDTMDANAFFFAYPNAGAGDHQVEVQARITTNVSAQAGTAAASATIGKGALTVEEVKYIKALDVLQ